MAVRYKKTAVNIVSGIALLFLILLQFSTTKIFNLGVAAPVLAIGFCVAVSFYLGETYGFIWGLICGMCFDALSSKICFSTIALSLIGLFAGLIITYVFNRNIGALIVLNIIASAVYFAADFVTHIIFLSGDSLGYLWFYSIPSFIYSAVFGVIISFIYGFIIKKLK